MTEAIKPDPRQLGIELDDRVRSRAQDLASRAGRAIQLRPQKDFLALEGARLEGGVPVIVLRDPEGMNAYNLAHGLLHLECEVSGYPRTLTRQDAQAPDLLSQILGELSSLVEHRVIYPRLAELGFDPAREIEEIVRQMLLPKLKDPATIEAMPEWPRKMWLILKCARVRLEIAKDSDVFLTADKLLREQYPVEWREALRIVSTIRSIDLSTPEAARKVLLACLHQLGCPEPETWIGVSSVAEAVEAPSERRGR